MQRIVILLFCFFPYYCLCQINARIHVDGDFLEDVVFTDTLELKNRIESQKMKWIREGFFFSGLDTIIYKRDASYIYFHKGNEQDLSIAGIKKRRVLEALSKALTSYINHGYPFAIVFLDSIKIENQELKGNIKIKRGPVIRYDSVFFFEKPRTNQNYVHQLLEITPGDLFNESTYQKLENRIERSPFLSLKRPPDISFSKNKARIYLDLLEKTTNSFQGVLGLQQNQTGGTSLVGSLDLSAQNLFRSGHEFQFNWESFAESSQQLDLFYKHAFLLNAKVSPSFRFGLLKQDTTFLTRTTALGISTYLGSKTTLLVEYEGTTGSLISSNEDQLINRNLADFKRNTYQLAFSSGYVSYLSSFNKGLIWEASIGGGTKEIVKNIALANSYYDTIRLKTNFLRIQSRFAYQIKIGKRQSIFQDIQIGVFNNKELLTNELYRIGGLNTLRGFNEKSIFAGQYSLSRFEFRSFFENSSYVYAFYDQLVFKRTTRFSYPLGIGLGFALETSSGQFSFALASGKSKSQRFSFSELRAHFGFITKF